MNPYEVLDVATSTTKDAIKRAYRKASQKAHPDKGGSSEKMSQVNQAYALLTDQSRRDKFDRTGDDSQDLNSPEAHACALISKIALAWAQNGPDCDLLDGIRMMLSKELDQQASERKKASDALKRMQRTIKKISKRKNLERDPICAVFNQQIPLCQAQIDACNKMIEMIKLAQTILVDYVLKKDEPEYQSPLVSPSSFLNYNGF